MKNIKIVPLIFVILILLAFIFMIVCLIRGNTSLFFITGGVLTGILIAGYFVLQVFKKKKEEKEKEI